MAAHPSLGIQRMGGCTDDPARGNEHIVPQLHPIGVENGHVAVDNHAVLTEMLQP